MLKGGDIVSRKLRGFKQIFSIVFALILGSVGLSLGLMLRGYIQGTKDPVMFLQWVKDVTMERPWYLTFLANALGWLGILFGIIIGPKAAQSLVDAGNALEQASTKDKLAIGIGALIGIIVTLPFSLLLSRLPLLNVPISLLLGIAFIYLGIRATMSMKDEFRFLGGPLPVEIEEADPTLNCKILDTNVIIDGRIADVCRAGFLEGPLYVSGFVLEELQHIADSGDSLKRARGRRGLDILNSMQKELPLIVRSWDKALDKSARDDEVDTRLVKLAKALNGAIVTNDFNLNKVAALQGVQVLNVNELANALKPVVLPGEIMLVHVVKEGKEPNQGVGYLDDGTMIVVEDGRRHMSETLGVMVTSVLQTAAGKMIFARVRQDDEGDGFDYNAGRNPDGGRPDVGNGATSSSGFTRRGTGKKIR